MSCITRMKQPQGHWIRQNATSLAVSFTMLNCPEGRSDDRVAKVTSTWKSSQQWWPEIGLSVLHIDKLERDFRDADRLTCLFVVIIPLLHKRSKSQLRKHSPDLFTCSTSLKQNTAQSTCAESTLKGVNSHSKDAPQAQNQRPESPTVTLTWHGCKYKDTNSTRGMCIYTHARWELP